MTSYFAQSFSATELLPVQKNVLGIIGGLGPAATCDLYQRIVGRFAAHNRQHFPRIIIDSVAMTPDMEKAFIGGCPSESWQNVARELLHDSVKVLSGAGASVIALPCNTLHSSFRKLNNGQFRSLDIVGTTIEAAASRGFHRIGVVGSGTIVESDIYSSAELPAVYPNASDQKNLEEYIYNAIHRRSCDDEIGELERIISRLAEYCDAIVLGCTDLSPLSEKLESPRPIVDSLACLADACVEALHD